MSKLLLEGYRALDLTEGEAQLCGRILSDLGVEVIRVEKPGGSDSRSIGPFFEDKIHPEKSLWWFFLNANKKGITLNLESLDGRGLFKELAKNADFVLESFKPGYLAGLGLDYSTLAALNPRLILASLTPFGQTGPYKDYSSSELVLLALGVFLFGTGDPDRPPVKPNYPLAGIGSAMQAASAISIAHYSCTRSTKGQHIDVSAQAGLPWLTGNVGAWWQMEKREIPRTGTAMARRPDLNIRFIWPCRDGHVLFQFFGGVVGSRSNQAMSRWVDEAGLADQFFKEVDWAHLDLYQVAQETMDRLERPVGLFLLSKGRQELVEEATRRGILLGYIDKMGDLADNAQLAAGDYWKEIEHPELSGR